MKRVLIYIDEGVGARSLQQLRKALKETSVSIKQADRNIIIDTEWEQETDVLIIPGGRDVPYHTALKGKGNQKIKAFVSSGGSYFGICAGAYYGCRSLSFEAGTRNAISVERELCFFPGSCSGPAYGNGEFHYEDERGARIAQLKLIPSGDETFAYYNGGCLFQFPEKYPSITTLAVYSNIPGLPAAIVECAVGKGKALLCGVHPEYSALQVKSPKDPYLERLIPQLAQVEQKRKELFTHLLCRLKIMTC